VLVFDEHLYVCCQECDGFGWLPGGSDDDHEALIQRSVQADSEDIPPRFACNKCCGLGVVKIALENIREMRPVGRVPKTE
jgi:hypothetical protein